MPLLKEKEKYTYQDYITWPDEERWEIIDGFAYDMSPAPAINHQTIVGNFHTFLNVSLRGKICRVFMAPTDVILSEFDVVQPDVFVVCDPKKIAEKNIQGAPDLVIEIISPSTATKDRREKFNLYEKNGVREYLIVEPEAKHVERFSLNEAGHFDRREIFDDQQVLPLKSLDRLEMPLWELFGVEKMDLPQINNK